jgi:hypothetical protein
MLMQRYERAVEALRESSCSFAKDSLLPDEVRTPMLGKSSAEEVPERRQTFARFTHNLTEKGTIHSPPFPNRAAASV